MAKTVPSVTAFIWIVGAMDVSSVEFVGATDGKEEKSVSKFGCNASWTPETMS